MTIAVTERVNLRLISNRVHLLLFVIMNERVRVCCWCTMTTSTRLTTPHVSQRTSNLTCRFIQILTKRWTDRSLLSRVACIDPKASLIRDSHEKPPAAITDRCRGRSISHILYQDNAFIIIILSTFSSTYSILRKHFSWFIITIINVACTS